MRTRYKKMSILMFVALLVLVFAGCAKPPTKELSDATAALQAAGDAGAQQYAADQYMSAEEALNRATQLMEAKKYKEAREQALEARRLAQDAHTLAVQNQNTANTEAQEKYNLALQAVNRANDAGAYTYAPQQMENARATLEQAKAAYEKADYRTAMQLADAALTAAQEAENVALQANSSQTTQTAQRAVQEIRDPGATPRPYPTEHVVIKGETLWWIAEYKQIYNDPFQWPLIYRANRAKIKDPDLIFPDQVFQIVRSPELTDDMIREAIRFAKTRGAWSLHDGK